MDRLPFVPARQEHLAAARPAPCRQSGSAAAAVEPPRVLREFYGGQGTFNANSWPPDETSPTSATPGLTDVAPGAYNKIPEVRPGYGLRPSGIRRVRRA